MSSQGADPGVVGPYLARIFDEAAWETADVELISGGKSNLTYLVTSSAGEVVLRRPPLGHVLPTAHDMVREHRIMTALGPTVVPVPTTLHLCTDTDVLGAPFYVMTRALGHICRDSLPPGYADLPEQRRSIGVGLVKVLADLHSLDPVQIGLGDFGKPEGFLARQVRRWLTQWEASSAGALPALDELGAALAADVPESGRTGIVHGDYRLDNTMLHPTVPGRITAVLDWELSSLGDPLADLGLLLVYWAEQGDPVKSPIASVTVLEGFPTRAEVTELYADLTGRDVSRLPWYVAFGYFKLAVVVAGIVARVHAGAMVGGGFEGMESHITPLVDLGLATLKAGTVL